MAILPPQPPGIRLHFIVKRFFVARSARRFSCTDMRAEAATTHSNTLKTRMAPLLRARVAKRGVLAKFLRAVIYT